MNTYDLHTHTDASPDCRMTPGAFVAAVQSRGLSGVAVTDHDTIEGALRLRDRRPSFDVIIGSEITLSNGAHLIGLFLNRAVKGQTLEETADTIRAQGGLVVLPHPFREVTGLLSSGEICEDWSFLQGHVDMIEVFNAKSSWESNERAMKLARLLGIPATAGSDAHRSSEIGGGLSAIGADDRALTGAALSSLDTEIRGTDLRDSHVRQIRQQRESVRRMGLISKNMAGPRLWRLGKECWEKWCEHRDTRAPLPFRSYGVFRVPAPLREKGLIHSAGDVMRDSSADAMVAYMPGMGRMHA